MTNEELRQRLKHAAGLLLGVSCDVGAQAAKIAELTIQVAELTAINESLRQELKQPHITRQSAPMTEAQREKHRERMRQYWAKKRAEQPPKAPKPSKQTPEEKRAANKLSAKKYQAKKRAERQAAATAQKSAQTP